MLGIREMNGNFIFMQQGHSQFDFGKNCCNYFKAFAFTFNTSIKIRQIVVASILKLIKLPLKLIYTVYLLYFFLNLRNTDGG